MKFWEKILATVVGVFLIFTEIGAVIGLGILLAVWLPSLWKKL